MEKVILWWKKRSLRDRRALFVLALVLPTILFWYMVTIPLQDRLQMARRVLQTRRNEAAEVQKLLQEYVILKGQLEGVEFKADDNVVPLLERSLRAMNASDSQPILNRGNVVIFGKRQPAAGIRLESAQPKTLWEFFGIMASAGVYLAEFELAASPKINEFSVAIKAWLPSQP